MKLEYTKKATAWPRGIGYFLTCLEPALSLGSGEILLYMYSQSEFNLE